MRECYVVYKRRDLTDLSRRVIICRGDDVFQGELELGDEDLTIPEVQKTLDELKRMRGSMKLLSLYSELPNDAPFKKIWRKLRSSSEFLQDQLVDAEEAIEEMSQYGLTAWVDNDNASENTYFEMKVTPEHLPQVELLAAKIYLGAIKLDLIFSQGAYYFTLTEADSEQPLFDEKFPNIASRGSGFQIRVYDNDADWQKLTLWQLLDERALNLNQIIRDGIPRKKSESKSEEKTSSGEPSSETYVVDEERLWARSKDAYGGSYTQTYLMLKPQTSDSISRRALFRYGNWCYVGAVDMDQEVKLGEVPHVLRKFQRQQGKLAYMCDIKSLPDNLPFSEPMKHFAMASAFLEEEMIKAETILAELTEYHQSRGIRPWVDEENGCQYFELLTTGDAPHYEEVELMASKTYHRGVVVITIYFMGSLYVTLSPSVDDQPLLDMSFPDVASKGRGLQISAYSHREFKKLMLWQSQRSVWETANRAVLEQRRMEALKRRQEATQSMSQMNPSSDESEDEEEVVVSHNEKSKIVSTSFDESKVESKTMDTVQTTPIQQREMRDESEVTSPSSKALLRSSIEQKSSSNVRAPHHLKPLGGVGALSSLPKLEGSLDAPWDSLGRPKSLFSKK